MPIALFGSMASGQSITNWQAPSASSADWFTASNWSGGIPNNSRIASIDNGGTATIDSGVAQADGLRLGFANSGHVVQTGGVLNLNDAGFVIGQNVGSAGSYTLNEGSLNVFRGLSLGLSGSGQFNQQGGGVVLTDQFMSIGVNADGVGVYRLSAGSFSAPRRLTVGSDGDGSFLQTGGTSAIADLRMASGVGSIGRYELQQGTLTTTRSSVGLFGDASFVQSGGTHTTTTLTMGQNGGPPQTASYTLAGDATELHVGIEIIGDQGNATFEQASGTHTVSTFLRVGNGPERTGTFNLLGGSLAAQELSIGLNGLGVFNQSGGTNIVNGDLHVGHGSGVVATATGVMNLGGGSLEVKGNEYVGYRGGHGGFGEFMQTGGVHTVDGNLTVADDDAPSGKFQIQGGELSVAGDLVLGIDNRSEKILGVIGGLSDIDIGGNFTMGPSSPTRPWSVASIHSLIDETGLSVINVGGMAFVQGQLNVELGLGYTPHLAEQFVVLTAADGVLGTLTLVGPAADNFELLSTPNSIILLSLIPEPSSISVAMVALCALILVAWKHRLSQLGACRHH
jgi:hypothetical protein